MPIITGFVQLVKSPFSPVGALCAAGVFAFTISQREDL